MNIKPTTDHGQELPPPVGKVIGFFDDKAGFDAFAQAAQSAGFAAAKIISLFGQDGIDLLERLKDHRFFFADAEDGVLKRAVRELTDGHYAVAVEVADHKQARQIAGLAQAQGGHGFNYFGTWVSEQLTN